MFEAPRWLWTVPLSLVLYPGVSAEPQEPPWLASLREALPPFSIERIEPEEVPRYNSVSPDGRFLAVMTERPRPEAEAGGPHTLRLYDEDGKLLRDLTVDRFYRPGGFMWSQTSDAILVRVTAWYEGVPDPDWLWKVDAHTGTMFPVTLRGLPTDHLPIWSPTDMSYLVVKHQRIADDDVRSTMFRVWSDSGRRKRLAGLVTSVPVWSPDGKWIAFGRQVRAEYETHSQLWIVRSDGRGQRLLVSAEDLKEEYERRGWTATGLDPRCWWIGDTDRVLVAGYRTDAAGRAASGIWLVDLGDPAPRWIDDGAVSLFLQGGSRDGRRLYLSVRHLDAEQRADDGDYKLTLESEKAATAPSQTSIH